MEFSKISYGDYHYIELYRYAGTYTTGIRFTVDRYVVNFNIYFLGFSLIIELGKEIDG